MRKIRFSVLIPAHNEEKYLPKCIEHIKTASKGYADQVEIIVTANRCTDRTVELAEQLGAKVVFEDAKNLAKIRNAGAKVAKGDIIITVDADSYMAPNMLTEVHNALEAGNVIGGCVDLRMERMSLGIFVNMAVIFRLGALIHGLPAGAGLFWCYRKDFERIGGFDEGLRVAEDIDFAKRLKKHGKLEGKTYRKLSKTYVTTSTRKFDQFGDWMYFKMIFTNFGAIKALFSKKEKGKNALDEILDRVFFHPKR